MEEIEIPWIIRGPGIVKNRMLEMPGDVTNTASTIVYLLGLEQPYAWTGRPALDAFKSSSYSKKSINAYVPQPFSSVKSGLYSESLAVSFEVSDPDVKVRFTTNGEEPDINSPEYKSPILLLKSTRVKTAGFIDQFKSRTTEVDFVKIVPIGKVKLKNAPAEKYLAKGDYTLADKEKGSAKFDDGKWLGFREDDLDATLTFANLKDVQKLSIGFLNNPGSWIFHPLSIKVTASVDGKKYVDMGELTTDDILQTIVNGRNQLSVKLKPGKARYLRIVAENTGVCPAGHSGAGEPAWLFVDEIIIE